MTRQILIIVHQKASNPGRIGEFLIARGYTLERCCPNLGEPLPQDLAGYAAVVVFGGPQSANDDRLPGIRAELDWLEARAVPSGRPLLGICLGAQEIARVLGARVAPHDDGLVEIGYCEVSPTRAGDKFLTRPTMFYQWHTETFDIPTGAVHLAESKRFPGQAFCYDGSVYGIEFHPEMTSDMIERWCASKKGRQRIALHGAQPPEIQMENYQRYATETDRWLGGFLDRLLLASAD
ncbi:MAG: glutamine amidotransferase [Gammaproteobacteria bacterium]|nr:glutamine amidotransferase [Gammaproteobacteria bacterium]